jgi:glucans biosynthesis protein C
MPDGKVNIKIERRYDYDWLRVICLFFVFVGHVALIFHPSITWIVNNPDRTFAVSLYCFWPEMWFLHLFFLVAGAASWYSLRKRSGKEYVVARIKRILVPMYTLGLFIILPFMYWFWISRDKGFQISYFDSLPLYFSQLFDIYPEPSALLPLPYEGYFWFLKFLFLISIFTLPVLLFLRTEKARPIIDALAGWCDKRFGILIFVIPVFLTRVLLYSKFGGWNGWASFASYALFYVIGFIMPADKRFSEGISKNLWLGLLLGIVGYLLSIHYMYNWNYDFYYEPISGRYFIFHAIYSLGRWGWIIFVMAMVKKYLNSNSKTLAYSNEAALPFYIIHLPIVMMVAYVVVRWDMSILAKYWIIVGVTFPIVMLIYNFLVRPFNPVRFFFGMGPKRKPAKLPANPQGSTA